MGNSHSSFSTGHNRGVTPFSIEKAILLAPLFPHSPFSIIPFCILRGVTTPNIWKLTTQIGLYHPKGIVCVSLMWSHLRPMVVTRVSVDYDIYLKNRSKSKEKGLRLLGSSSSICPQMTTIFETLGVIPRVRDWSMRLGTSTGHECLRPTNGGLFLWGETRDG